MESLVTLSLLGIAASTAGLYLMPAAAPLAGGADLVDGMMRVSRSRAIATTSAYRVTAADPSHLIAERAQSCFATTWTRDDELELELPRDVVLTDTSWSVCFSSRGLAAGNITIPLHHPETGSLSVEVLLGGSSRVIH